MTSRRSDPQEAPLSLEDRGVYALIGCFFGTVYGLFFAFLLVWLVDSITPLTTTVTVSALMFAVLGFCRGPLIADLIAALAWFCYGVLHAFADWNPPTPLGDTARLMRTLFWFGVATGVLVWLAI
ncbi:hypothetical protein [Jeongeupia naejangsanensis]|uniref:Uncharacterized protein n=1 Tax=Jeongeupia naejangsanensis TaxID=613195 RepID=A0ABS2BIA1_9NEIS|nr:hypothetical protein [Jeongeupia naejangsanensis]MBM3115334.1 hypothetical protein [Jeongeupia naejangsanensis]